MTLPLEGIRIADLTQAWAGSYATQILADAGAEVIKVEARQRPDPWRGGFYAERGLLTYAGEEPGSQPYNRSYLANSVNRNKLGITLDLSDARGRELFLQMVETSDLVMENFTPRVLNNLGIGFDALTRARSNIVLVSMPAFGLSGPYRDYPGIGGTVEPLSGNSSLLSVPGEGPRVSGAMYPDPVAGINGASAAVLGLFAFGLRGEAVHLEVSQHEAMMAMLGEFFATGGENHSDAVGNSDQWLVPTGAFQTRDDRWLAVSIANDNQWRALCAESSFALLHSFGQLGRSERYERGAELDAGLRQCLASTDAEAASAKLTELGIPNAIVCDMDTIVESGPLRESGFFRPYHQPGVGRHEVAGPLVKFGDEPWNVRLPAARHGEHSRQILTGMLGVSVSEYEELAARGVTGEGPPD